LHSGREQTVPVVAAEIARTPQVKVIEPAQAKAEPVSVMRADIEATSATAVEQQSDSDCSSKSQPFVGKWLDDDQWELDAELRSVQRLVERLRVEPQPSGGRLDMRAEGASSPHWPAAVSTKGAESRPSGAAAESTPRSSLAAWMLLSLGLATFACGAVLLGWSFIADRDDLWPIGLPLALAGQAGLIVGLVLQLEGLWSTSRRTEKTLTALDDELGRVRTATTLLSSAKSTSAQSFYLHLAEGAQPQLLLADLKGQLDLLAQQMASSRR
jgi:hypothetical protein